MKREYASYHRGLLARIKQREAQRARRYNHGCAVAERVARCGLRC